jgi:ketosteroid isomerase-like protein
MSQENLELARELIDRWNRGEREFSDDEVAPDVQVVSRFQTEPFRGRDGLRRWMQEIDLHFKEWHLVIDKWRDAGDLVVGLGHIELRGQESGVELEQPMGWLIGYRDGRLLSMQTFPTPGEALEAAGIGD